MRHAECLAWCQTHSNPDDDGRRLTVGMMLKVVSGERDDRMSVMTIER